MLRAPFKVILDANVLYPFTLRDTLLRTAEDGFCQIYWSAEILEETRRNLVANAQMTEDHAAKLVATMIAVFPEAMVTAYEAYKRAAENQEKDRHVVAAAIKIGAQVIVTCNIKDFQNLPEGIEAQTPDVFLANLFDLDPRRFVELLKQQATDLKNPPVAFDQLLLRLQKVTPNLVSTLRHLLGP
jgi:predicted nucleic acid-binding protein